MIGKNPRPQSPAPSDFVRRLPRRSRPPMPASRSGAWPWALALLLALVFSPPALAQNADEPKPAAEDLPPAPSADADLAAQQEHVAKRFDELEKVLIRMSELLASSDPRRATLLRQAVAQSKDRDIAVRLEIISALLRDERLSQATRDQGEVRQDLQQLLELLLSEDRQERLRSEKARIREYLKQLSKLIKEQQALRAETDRAQSTGPLGERQEKLADNTGKLGEEVDRNEGQKGKNQPSGAEKPSGGKPKSDDSEKDPSAPEKSPPGEEKGAQKESPAEGTPPKDSQPNDSQPAQPGEGKPGPDNKGPNTPMPPGAQGQETPPSDQQAEDSGGSPPTPSDSPPARQRLRQAEQRMREAREKLEQAKKDEAQERQAQAEQELREAVAELEEILRQLREEEIGQTLAMLESRFRKMLEMQTAVYEATQKLDQIPAAERNRDHEIESGRLSRKEGQIAAEADKALTLLREEGSAVAFSEAVTAMRDDMEQVVLRLSRFKIDDVTQQLEREIIVAIEEMIASLNKAQKDQERKKNQPSQSSGGEPPEPPLVDRLAELRMIRALQLRVNRQTQSYGARLQAEQAQDPDLVNLIRLLSEREKRVYRATRDIVAGRNE